jgi:hypothetical protein
VAGSREKKRSGYRNLTQVSDFLGERIRMGRFAPVRSSREERKILCLGAGVCSFLPLLVQGEVGAIPIATGEVQRRHTREAYSCTPAIVVRVARNLSLTLSSDKERGFGRSDAEKKRSTFETLTKGAPRMIGLIDGYSA